jgi:hypothetical protein
VTGDATGAVGLYGGLLTLQETADYEEVEPQKNGKANKGRF